ncbi:MAG: hypothetical protein AB1673_09975 [Actinomycetota bacterium]|jgi:hypothetical protein
MSEQRFLDDRVGSSDHPQHRADDDEGYRAPSVDETGVAQQSIFDGAGNEVVVVTTTDEDGRRKQGTGASFEEALADAQDSSEPIGDGFGPGGGH